MPAAHGRQVVILHGWSDTSESFKPLVAFLRKNGFKAVPLWLGDYISMDDDVRIEDVAKRLEAAVRKRMTDKTNPLVAPFDMIVHSTGGLVARRWIASYHGAAPAACPVKRLVMLAPANFGSPLASKGKSFLGRVVKGFRNWFHTGREMLDSLELASAFQWNLAQRDLLVAPGDSDSTLFYGGEGIWPFVIVGSHPYTSLMHSIVSEDGTDGTVRVAGASMNARGITLDFTEDRANGEPLVTEWGLRRRGAIPLAVLPARTHGSVIDPGEPDVVTAEDYHDPLGDLVLGALRCESAQEYEVIAREWNDLSAATARLGERDQREERARLLPKDDEDDSEHYFHRYSQIVVRVVDDHGSPVGDYFLEFLGPDDDTSDEPTIYLHRNVLEHVHKWSRDPSFRCLNVDWTDLVHGFYPRIGQPDRRVLRMSISAAPAGKNVSYFLDYKIGARGLMTVHRDSETSDAWLQPSCTHLVRIVIPRTPRNQVFHLRRAP